MLFYLSKAKLLKSECNFGYAELIWNSDMKRKDRFPFAFPSFFDIFLTFDRINILILFSLTRNFRNFAA